MACQCPKIYTVFSIITLLLQRLWRQKTVNWSEIELHKHSSDHYPVDRNYCDFELFAYFLLTVFEIASPTCAPFSGSQKLLTRNLFACHFN